jgi:hypothetical protein
MAKKIFYYSVSFQTILNNKTEDNADKDFLILDETSLNAALLKEKIEGYYHQNKIPFSGIRITGSKSLTEKEYYIRTHYC